MPEITVVHIGIIAMMTVIGAIVAWVLRGKRSQQEKAAVSRGWQEQINAQRMEHDRLVDQNKGLMEQVSQYLASNQDAKNRAKELSLAVQEAYARRDSLQREIKDIRNNLEASIAERNQLKSDISSRTSDVAKAERKDAQIKKLQRELENWQNRLPPLIEKFRQKNEDAEQLRAELDAAHVRIAELQADANQTRIEPVSDPDTLTNGRDACNDPDDSDDSEDLVAADDVLDAASDTDTPASSSHDDGGDDEDEEDEEDNEILATDESINGSRDSLQAIKGVGPAIEKTLNEMGIFSYQQIANMSEYDIDRIANRLKGFRSRIYREDWIGQARELSDQKLGG
jgi:predicted flap endonuclease-1-like 5' DNA nuclease